MGIKAQTIPKVTFHGWYVFTDNTSFEPYDVNSTYKNCHSLLLHTIIAPNPSQFSCVEGHYHHIVDCSSITKHFLVQFHVEYLHSILISSLCWKKKKNWVSECLQIQTLGYGAACQHSYYTLLLRVILKKPLWDKTCEMTLDLVQNKKKCYQYVPVWIKQLNSVKIISSRYIGDR